MSKIYIILYYIILYYIILYYIIIFFVQQRFFFAPMLDIRAGRIADVRWMQMVRVPCRQCEAYLSRSVGNLVVPKLMQAGPVGGISLVKGHLCHMT